MSTTEGIARGLMTTLLGRIIRFAANGLLLIVLTRYLLDPASYGLLMLTLSILTLAQLFSNLGLARSAARYVTEYRETAPGQVRYILRRTIFVRTVAVVVTAVAILVGAGTIAGFVDEPDIVPLLYVGVLYIAVDSYRSYGSVVFQGFNSVEWSALAQIANSVSRLTLALVFIIGFGLGALGALLGYVIGAAVAATLSFGILYWRFYRRYDDANPEQGLMRRVLEYTLPLTVTKSAGVINGKLDVVLIGYFLSSGPVGLYVLAKQITSFALVPAGSLGFSISPTYGEQKAAGNLDRAARIYETTLKYTLSLYVPAAVGLFLIAEPTVRYIFGPDYLGAVPSIQIFAVYLVLQAVVQITTEALDYLGRARVRAMAKGGTAGGNAVLNILLIPPLGIAGAAIATVLTTGVYTALNVYVMHREVSLRYTALARSLVTIAAVAGVVGVAVTAVRPFIRGIPMLLGTVALGVCLWAVVGVGIGLIELDLLYRTLGGNPLKTDTSD